MGAHLVVLLAAVLQVPQDTIRITYASPATEALVVRAAERHRAQDTAVSDYRARIRYRLSVSLGRRRWARAAVAAVEEQDAVVAWQRPNDLRVDVLGRRFRSRSERLELSSMFDRPWFVPRGLGDSVRLFSNEFPATGALHPLAAGADAAYHYDLIDSLSVTLGDGRSIRLFSVQVIPKVLGPALVAGRLWLDAETAEVVRFTFRYVGTALWARPDGDARSDSASARRINRLVNRLLTIDADLEYSLQDGRHWMPYRQSIAGTVKIPVVTDVVIPFQAVTTFDDYEINTGRPVEFAIVLPDSAGSDSVQRSPGRASTAAGRWTGGRFEMHRPPDDSLALYSAWRDSLRFGNIAEDDGRVREAGAELARIAEELPDELTGRPGFGFAYENLADALQYNRVQGLSVGAGLRLRVPGASFTDLFGTARYGISDRRATGRLALVRDAPGGRVSLSAYRDVVDVDPFSPGRTLASSANALFTAHDDADYYLASGGALGFVTSVGLGLDLSGSLRGERQRSVVREAKSAVNDFLGGEGLFPPNPPVADGDYGVASIRLTKFGAIRWSLVAEGMAGEGRTTGRAMLDARVSGGGARGYTIRLKGGLADAAAPPQFQFRLGGMQTVRGFEYGSARGAAFWAAQLDVSPLRGTIRPVLFADAGQAGAAEELFGSEALVGGGIGVSVYSPLLRTTLFRIDLSHPISPDTGGKWRFDVVFSPVR